MAPGSRWLRPPDMLRASMLAGERGWRRQAVRMKPFWIPGRRGLDEALAGRIGP
jgi:hypothetical protein